MAIKLTNSMKVFYLGDTARIALDFNPEQVKNFKEIGKFSPIGSPLKGLVKGEFLPNKKNKTPEWQNRSLRNETAYFYLEGFKVCEKLDFDINSNFASFHYLQPDKIKAKQPYRIFVAMAFDQAFDDIYIAIQDTVKSLKTHFPELNDYRVDQHLGVAVDLPRQIAQDIQDSGIFIADLTSLNMNVFYEIGVADSLRKRIIFIAKENTVIPFDLRHRRVLFFTNIRDLRNKLERNLAATLQNM